MWQKIKLFLVCVAFGACVQRSFRADLAAPKTDIVAPPIPNEQVPEGEVFSKYFVRLSGTPDNFDVELHIRPQGGVPRKSPIPALSLPGIPVFTESLRFKDGQITANKGGLSPSARAKLFAAGGRLATCSILTAVALCAPPVLAHPAQVLLALIASAGIYNDFKKPRVYYGESVQPQTELPAHYQHQLASAMAGSTAQVQSLLFFLKTLQVELKLKFDVTALRYATRDHSQITSFINALLEELEYQSVSIEPKFFPNLPSTVAPLPAPCNKPHPALLKISVGNYNCTALKVAPHHFMLIDDPTAGENSFCKSLQDSVNGSSDKPQFVVVTHEQTQKYAIYTVEQLYTSLSYYNAADRRSRFFDYNLHPHLSNAVRFVRVQGKLPGADAYFGYELGEPSGASNLLKRVAAEKVCMQAFSYDGQWATDTEQMGNVWPLSKNSIIFAPDSGAIVGVGREPGTGSPFRLIPSRDKERIFRASIFEAYGFNLLIDVGSTKK